MSATTEKAPAASPEAAYFAAWVDRYRASIPLVYSSLETVNDVLSKNAYTRTSYIRVKEASATAVKYAEPLQDRITPYIAQAPVYVREKVDLAQSKLPQVKREEVTNYILERKKTATDFVLERKQTATEFVLERKQTATEFATKSFDENKARAITAAVDLDTRMTPVVDYLDTAIHTRLPKPTDAGPSKPDPVYQYQRALALSREVYDYSSRYSAEQFKKLQEHNALVQKATQTAQSIAELAASSAKTASARINVLSDTLVVELQKIRESSKELSISLKAKAQELPGSKAAHELYTDATEKLEPIITKLRAIKSDPAPWSEKIPRVRDEVSGSVAPVLEAIRKRVSELLARKPETPLPEAEPEEEDEEGESEDESEEEEEEDEE